MGISEPKTPGGWPSLGAVQNLYDQHRFLDAYQATQSLWTAATNVAELSIEELVFAGRLARHLGGDRLSRSLLWRARKRDPQRPLVRYFTHHLNHPRELLLDDLAAFEQDQELGGEDDELRASWIAAHAYTWGSLRNYRHANELLVQAHRIFPGSSWITAIEADVLGMADEWSGSLSLGKMACELDNRSARAVNAVCSALMNLGRIEEAVQFISRATMDSQSPQLVEAACWYHCALAELSEGDERAQTLVRAQKLAERIEPLAPLADRDFTSGLARIRLDIAQVSGDHAEMARWAAVARSPFHRQMLANLTRNPDGKRIRLSFRRRIQKHEECVPTSIGSALSATGVDISVESLAADVTFGGTLEWAAADWLRNQGFHTRFFSADVQSAAALIEAGIGFVVTWEDDQNGHAVAIVGIDHAAGVLIAHDPMSFRCTEYLFEVFNYHQGPLGILGLAAVPKERAHQLDDLLPAESQVMELAQAHAKAAALQGVTQSRQCVERIQKGFSRSPGARYLEAVQELNEGRVGRARALFQQLLNEFPNSPSVRIHFMDACRAIGNTVLVRNTLRGVVETCAIPGVASENDWLRPHPRYVWEYADLLRTSSTTRKEALKLLRGVLRRSWALAGAWHVLADHRWVERGSSALQAYAIASYLEPHNEHYARAYFDALGHAAREEEGLQWLERRVKDLGGSNRGVSTWITYISALEERGHPERAITVCQACLQSHSDSAPATAFAVAFLARMGKWSDAEEQLEKLAHLGAEGAFHEAATAFYRMRGQRSTALEHSEKWVRECPRSMAARQAVLELKSSLLGPQAAVQQAGFWLREFPANEDFEEAFCRFARDVDRRRTLGVLRRRVARNREDGWAWRELAFTAMSLYRMGDEAHRNRHRRRIVRYLSEADRVAPDDSPTLRAHGFWKEGQGDWRGAVDSYVESIRCDPTHFFAYQRAWEISSRFPEEERRQLWNAIQPLFLQTTAHLANALEMIRLLAERFGVRETEQIVGEWREKRPDDPNVVEAYADLLLNHGHGRSDIERALELLQVAAERFPYHSGLHFSLARAYRALGEFQKAKEVFQELARSHSDDVNVLIQLAWIAQHDGDTEQALRLVGSACEQQPQNPAPIDARARILIDAGRVDDARMAVALSFEQHAERVPIYERAIALFAESGSPEKAVDAARKGTATFPRGAYLWLLLGRTLKQFPQFAAVGEIEACFRRSLQLNCALVESADWLAVLLAERGRHEDSTKILESIEPHMPDPAPALGRLAWVKRKSGQKEQAYTELRSLLGREPWYAWGWNQLLTWLEDDKDGYRAKDLLFCVPAQMMSDVAFRQRRLRLLEMAKVDARVLDAEWEVVLAEFPENIPLHQRRYDSLAGENRWSEASSVLEKIAPIGENDSFLLARMIELECRNGKRCEAVDHGLQVSFAALENSPWPVNQAWSHLKKAGWMDDFTAQFWTRLKGGDRPTHRALACYADDLLAADHSPRWLRWLRHTRLNHTTRRLHQLMQILERSNWLDHRHIAELFAGLNHHRHGRVVLSSWKRMEDRHLERDSAIWAQIGVAMVNLDRKPAGRVFMHDWRERVGVPMWALANYLSCIGRVRRSDLNEVALTSHDALRDLPHDHCARYLAYVGAEALALKNDTSGLLEAWDRYGVYFEGSLKQGEYFPEKLKYLFADLPVLARALRSKDLQLVSKLTRALRWRRIWDQQFRIPLLRAWRMARRLILILWLGGMIAVLFLR